MGGEEGKLEERIQDIFDRSLSSYIHLPIHLHIHLHIQSLDDRDHSIYSSCSNLSLGGSGHQNTKEQATIKVSLVDGSPLETLIAQSSVLSYLSSISTALDLRKKRRLGESK